VIVAAVSKLDSGQVSSVIRLPNAFAVIRWDEKEAPRQATFEERAPTIREGLKSEKELADFKAFLAELQKRKGMVIYPPFE